MPVETGLYDTLGIAPTATPVEIKKAYRKLALIHHPDKGGKEEDFKRITGAYKILVDPEKRKMYDQFGENGLRDSGGLSDDILSSLFGDSPFGNIFNMFRDVRNATRRSPAVTYTRRVTLEELCTRKVINIKVTRNRTCRCQKNISSQTKCKHCKGTGQIQTIRRLAPGMIQQINHICNVCGGRGMIISSCENCKNGVIEVPKIFHIHLTPDMENNYQYKFAGEGNEIPTQLPGDFIVIIVYKPHEQFTLQGKDLMYTRSTTLKEALCGYSCIVIHPSGENILVHTVPGNVVNPKQKTIVNRKGMDSTSNLIIRHDIVFPETLTAEQIKKLSKILV